MLLFVLITAGFVKWCGFSDRALRAAAGRERRGGQQLVRMQQPRDQRGSGTAVRGAEETQPLQVRRDRRTLR